MPQRFSVLIPAYNGAAVLSGAIRSVLAQICADWELIVGDNASEEDLASIVAACPDPRIRYVRFDDHVAIFDNFNRTFALATGEWVYLLPADDRLAPEALACIGRTIDENPDIPRRLALVTSRANRVDPEGRPFDREYYGFEGAGRLPTGRHDAGGWMRAICSPGSPPWEGGAFRREVVEEMGVFFRRDEPSMSADLELTLRIAAYGDVVYLDEPLISVTGWVESHTTGRRARNRASGEHGTPESLALASALRAHRARRTVTRDERTAVRGAMARSYLRRATAHRYRLGGRGRVAALRDVASAVRLGGHAVLGRALLLAPVVGLAPSSSVQRVRAAAITARAAPSVPPPSMAVQTPQTDAPAVESTGPDSQPSNRTRTAGWGLADQVVASGSNFALGLAAARALDPAPLGAFAIVFSVYLLALNLSRAAIAQPLAARFGHADHATWRAATAMATGTACSFGVLGAGIAALAGVVVGGDICAGLLMLAVCLPGLVLQDALRYAFVAGGRPRQAFVIDALWAIVAVVPLAWFALARPAPLAYLVLAWGASGTFAGVVGVAIVRVRPRPSGTCAWLHRNRDLLPALVGGSILEMGAQTFTTAGIASIAGLAAAGALRVGQLLLSPAFVMYQAASLVVPPEAARLRRATPDQLAGFLARVSAILAGVTLGVAVVIVIIPDAVGLAILPTNWTAGHALIPMLSIALAGQVTVSLAVIALVVLAAMRRAFRMSVTISAVLTIAQLVGASVAGAPGVAVGLAIAYPTLAIIAWAQTLAALGDRTRQAAMSAGAMSAAAMSAAASGSAGHGSAAHTSAADVAPPA